MSGAYSQFFSGRGRPTNFRHFFKSSFFAADLILSNLSTKNNFRRSGGMLPWKIFEILHTAMAILVRFEQFLKKVCSYFWPLTLSASPMMHFVHIVSIMRA